MSSGGTPRGASEGFPDQRYRRGLKTANELAGGEAVEALLENLRPISRDTSRLVIETVFGSLHHLPGLDHRQRELVTLAALAALGDTEDQLVIHLGIAHRIGVPPSSVVATFTHISAYAGFPRTLNALTVAKRFYAELGLLPLDEQ